VTRGSRRSLHPDTIARIRRLELRAREIVEGVLAGLHQSPFRGQSVEFLQHREYVRGDDLRRVDWKVWGRQDRYTVKEFEEESNLRLTLLVDGSASMDYAGDAAAGVRPTKFELAATLAASLAWLALSHGDSVGCAVFDDGITASVPARTRRSQVTSVCDLLETPRQAGPGDMHRALRAAAEMLPKRGLVIVLSDLLGDRAGLSQGLKLLRARGHDVAVLHLLDDDEIDFPFEGATRFEGLELPAHVACNPRALREGYLAAINEFLVDVRRLTATLRCDYALIRTGESPSAAIVRFLSRRSSAAS